MSWLDHSPFSERVQLSYHYLASGLSNFHHRKVMQTGLVRQASAHLKKTNAAFSSDSYQFIKLRITLRRNTIP